MKGVDLSSNNTYDIVTNPDNFDYFLIKTTEGTSFVNPDAARWIAQCKTHNRRYGIYHYYRGNGIAEAAFFLRSSVIVGYHHTAGNLIPFLDVETDGAGDSSGILQFRDAVTRAWNCHTGFYSYDFYIIEHNYPEMMAQTMPLWFSNPSGNPVPKPWTKAAITQTVLGSNGSLDIDESSLPASVVIPTPLKPLWVIHANDTVIGHTRHPKIWENTHPRRFSAKHRRQLGFRQV